ncbi:CHY zinc finger protein [Leucobacter sp. GX24907]
MTASIDPRGHGPRVLGATIDEQTRCIHYSSESDVIALQFKCCGDFYPCFACHEAAEHPATRWAAQDRAARAVLCGVCRHLLSIDDYLTATVCPDCDAQFNPGCLLHHDLYFDFPHPTATEKS